MPKADRSSSAQIVIKDRVRLSSWLWIAFGLAVLAVSPWVLMSAGTEEVMARRPYSLEYDSPTYAFAQPLYIIVTLLGYPIVVALLLLRQQPVVQVEPDRISLRGKGNARASWAELDRVVIWRMRVKRLGFIPGWEPKVGLVKDTERTRAFQAAAGAKQWREGDFRPNGVPEWLPGGIHKHSTRLAHSRATALAAAVARFAPHIEVVDERFPGRSTPVEPRR